jgi:hypothetical protein
MLRAALVFFVFTVAATVFTMLRSSAIFTVFSVAAVLRLTALILLRACCINCVLRRCVLH